MSSRSPVRSMVSGAFGETADSRAVRQPGVAQDQRGNENREEPAGAGRRGRPVAGDDERQDRDRVLTLGSISLPDRPDLTGGVLGQQERNRQSRTSSSPSPRSLT
jgi:hypothetical protein